MLFHNTVVCLVSISDRVLRFARGEIRRVDDLVAAPPRSRPVIFGIGNSLPNLQMRMARGGTADRLWLIAYYWSAYRQWLAFVLCALSGFRRGCLLYGRGRYHPLEHGAPAVIHHVQRLGVHGPSAGTNAAPDKGQCSVSVWGFNRKSADGLGHPAPEPDELNEKCHSNLRSGFTRDFPALFFWPQENCAPF